MSDNTCESWTLEMDGYSIQNLLFIIKPRQCPRPSGSIHHPLWKVCKVQGAGLGLCHHMYIYIYCGFACPYAKRSPSHPCRISWFHSVFPGNSRALY